MIFEGSPSPALLYILDKAYSDTEKESIVSHYRQAANLGSIYENDIQRSEGASFNPRPCRIAQILITDIKNKALDNIIISFYVCAVRNAPHLKADSQDSFLIKGKEIFSFYLDLDTTISYHKNDLDITSALILDELRHIHLGSISPERKLARLNLIEKNLSLFSSSIIFNKIKFSLEMARKSNVN